MEDKGDLGNAVWTQGRSRSWNGTLKRTREQPVGWEEKGRGSRREVPNEKWEPKDIDYNAGGQGKKGKKNLRRRNTEHKEKKINNSRELLNQEGEKTIYI